MKLQANTGWVIVRRVEPTEKSEGGILLPTKSNASKITRGTLVAWGGDLPGAIPGDITDVLFRGGEPFDHRGEKLIALETKDVIATLASTPLHPRPHGTVPGDILGDGQVVQDWRR